MAGAREEPAIWRSAIEVAQLLSPTKWKRTPEGAKACCPCHDDNDPTLYISEGDDRLIVFCQSCRHAGQQAIFDELQARGIQLFRDEPRATANSRQTKPRNVEKLVPSHFATDAQGEQLHRKDRYEEYAPDGTRTGKRFDWLTKHGHNGSARSGSAA